MVYYTIVRRGGEDRAAKDAACAEGLGRLLPLFGKRPDEGQARDERGRRYLPACPDLDFNLSHAHSLTVVAVGTTRVGVDVECADRIRDPEALARRFFTENERREVLSAADKADAALTVWTRKEAFGKHVGTGLSATLDLCTCTPPDDLSFYTTTLAMDGHRYTLTLCGSEPPVAVDEGAQGEVTR